MKLLKNRKVAIIITIIVAVVATMFGVNRSLNRLSREVEVMFYEGVFLEDRGFREPGINSHLENIAQAALDCSSVLAAHPELSGESEALLSARRELLDAGSISEKYFVYRDLLVAFGSLISQSAEVDLSERETASVTAHYSKLTGAVTAIDDSRYNQIVWDFMEDVSIFAYLFRSSMFVTYPQAFGPMVSHSSSIVL
jgi:hypothetical protein